jgi:putative membrane protein (TIGR04086 family)
LIYIEKRGIDMKNITKNSKKHTSTHTDDSGILGNNFRSIGIAALSALLSLVLLTFIFSALSLLYSDPQKLISPLSIIALCLSSALGGFVCKKSSSFSSIAAGLLTGAILLIIYIFLSFAFKAPQPSDLTSVLSFRISVPLSSTIGAYLSTKHKARKRRRR